MEEESFALGALQSDIDVRDYKIEVNPNQEFPSYFKINIGDRVKNQGQVSSCVAHALSTIIECHNARQNLDFTEMSTGWIYGNRRDQPMHKGVGLHLRNSIQSVCNYGDLPYEIFPQNVDVPTAIELFEYKYPKYKNKALYCRFSGYYRVTDEKAIKKSLMKDGPVIISIQWYEDIKVVNDIITTSKKEYMGNHTVVIYGWDKRGWYILNSWGRSWGNQGKAILPYSYHIKEAYGITDDILDQRDDIIKPYNSKLKKIIAKVFNFFLNILNNIRRSFKK